MSKLPGSFLLICVLSLIGVQKCLGVLDVKLQDNMIASAPTPFTKNGNIDFNTIGKIAQYYKNSKYKVVLISGYYGEGVSLNLRDRKRLVNAWSKYSKYFDIIVEVGALPFPDVLELASYCSQYNITALTFFREAAYQATIVDQILGDFQQICDASCNIPLVSHILVPERIPPEAVFKAAVNGKVSCWVGEMVSISRFLSNKANVDSIAGYQLWNYGWDSIAAAYKTRMNATVAVRLFPELDFKIRDLVNKCDLDGAADAQQDLNRRLYSISNPFGGIRDIATRTFVARLIAGFELVTGIPIGYRKPVIKPNSTVINKIRSNLKKLRVRLYGDKKRNNYS